MRYQTGYGGANAHIAPNATRLRMARRPAGPIEQTPELPVETLHHWYVTVCGGRSPELHLDEIGINRLAVEKNTTLDPATDRVRVTILGHTRRPLLMDRMFTIVPLDERHPDAFGHSPGGEAVFPEGDDVVRPGQSPVVGQQVLLNNVVSPRLGLLPSAEEFARILREVIRRGTPEIHLNA